MGLFTLHNGTVYTAQWDCLHCTMGLFTLHNGSVYTAQWDCVSCLFDSKSLILEFFRYPRITVYNNFIQMFNVIFKLIKLHKKGTS